MTTQTSNAALYERTVGNIAATLPGATAVFRKHKIDFCCNGDLTLESAARRRGIDPDELKTALESLDEIGKVAAPATMDSDALIEHIQAYYHGVYRRDLPELIKLARKVEAVHREHPNVPAGLADTLRQIESDLEQHMNKEEMTLFPAMRQRTNIKLDGLISELRNHHDDRSMQIHTVESLTNDFTLPEGACRSWQALYVSAERFAEDLMEHIHLENNVLFPRFAETESQAQTLE
jgi:regulator of cell morphogenesis and NO signaling